MIRDAVKRVDYKQAALRAAQAGLIAYKFTLKTRLLATDTAITGLKKIAHNNKKALVEQQKENEKMKSFLSALTVLAVAGAALGAAGYYLYKKEKELNEYEELLYSDDFSGDFDDEEEDDGSLEKMARAAGDVKDIISSASENVKETMSGASENVKETVSGAYNDVKEAINHAMDK